MLTARLAGVEAPDYDKEICTVLRPDPRLGLEPVAAVLYRCALVNDQGKAYRIVLVYNEQERLQLEEAARLFGLSDLGPTQGFNAVFGSCGRLNSTHA